MAGNNKAVMFDYGNFWLDWFFHIMDPIGGK